MPAHDEITRPTADQLLGVPLPEGGLGTFSFDGGAPFPGLVRDGAVVDLRPTFGDDCTTRLLVERWAETSPTLRELGPDPTSEPLALERLAVRPPLEPRQVLCAGANYFGHVREMAYDMARRAGDERPDGPVRADAARAAADLAQRDPFLFAGLLSALVGAHDDIVLRGPGHQHDWELELAVVIGRAGQDVEESDAMAHVAGYTMSNDISTRDMLTRPNFPMSDLLMTKSRPTFFPMGPVIVPRELVPDPADLKLKLTLNGEVVQDGRTDDFIHSIARLVAYASRAFGLHAGDLLLTGSPAGNAAHHGNRWLRPGDVLEGAIEGLGTMRNRCVASGGDA